MKTVETKTQHASRMSNNYPRRHQVYTEMSRLSRWYEKQDLGAENPPQTEDKYSRCDISEAAEILEQTACDRLSLLLSWSLESSCSMGGVDGTETPPPRDC